MRASLRSSLAGSVLALGALASVVVLAREMLSMKACLFSATRGVVTRNGAPVANAEVERTFKWGWRDQTDSDKVRTDAQGRFAFDSAWGSTLVHGVLPLHRMVIQTITIRDEGKEYRAWSLGKHNFDELGEVGKPIALSCELNAEDTNRKTHWGIARLEP